MPSRLGHGLYKKIDRLKNIFRCIYIIIMIGHSSHKTRPIHMNMYIHLYLMHMYAHTLRATIYAHTLTVLACVAVMASGY